MYAILLLIAAVFLMQTEGFFQEPAPKVGTVLFETGFEGPDALKGWSDLVIFEGHGWDWTYHAFREWSGWSVEHGSDRESTARAEQPTTRQTLLCDWLARNRKPVWK